MCARARSGIPPLRRIIELKLIRLWAYWSVLIRTNEVETVFIAFTETLRVLEAAAERLFLCGSTKLFVFLQKLWP